MTYVNVNMWKRIAETNKKKEEKTVIPELSKNENIEKITNPYEIQELLEAAANINPSIITEEPAVVEATVEGAVIKETVEEKNEELIETVEEKNEEPVKEAVIVKKSSKRNSKRK